MTKIKIILIQSVDIIFALVFLSIAMPLLGWLLDYSTEWSTITFGEFFDDRKWWFNLWILSLFYVPMRALLRNEFWNIIFGKK